MSHIEQVQITYVAAEDRLLLRVASNADEFRFWLTRRFVAALRPQLAQRLARQPHISVQANPDARRGLLELEREHAVSRADFATPFRTTERQLPLGAQPVLLTRFTLRPGDDGALVLGLAPAQGQGIDLTLQAALVHNILVLLDGALGAADWQLGTPVSAPDSGRDAPHVVN